MGSRWVGPAVFLVSAAVLAAQVVLVRIFSINSYHHFAHMAIGVALLGFGASGTLLVLLERRLRDRLESGFVGLCIAFPLTLILGAWVATGIPFEPTQLLWAPRQWAWLILIYGGLTAPFLVAAGAIGIALMAAGDRVGRIYAWNLVGSGLGSAAALLLLAVARPDRALAWVLALAVAGAIAAIVSRGLSTRRVAVATLLILVSGLSIAAPPWTLAVTPFKGLPQVEAFPDAHRVAEAWAPTGWAAAVESPAFRHAPGLSLGFIGSVPRQVALFVDGETAGAATDADPASLDFMDWLPSSAAYAPGPADRVLVLGSGGGSEVLNARRHGARSVTDVELVEPLLELRRHVRVGERPGDTEPGAVRPDSGIRDLRGSTGGRTVAGDVRAFVARGSERFDRVVLPVSGAMAAASSGVYSLGEDYMNTVDAYRQYLERLSPGGILVITRWMRTPPRDNVRLLLTAAEALRAHGVEEVGGALLFVRSWATGTLLVKPDGFDSPEVDRVRGFARDRRFDVDWPPDPGPVFNAIERPVFAEAARAAAAGPAEARAFADAYPFQVNPPTDDRPYFGRFLRLRGMRRLLAQDQGVWLPFAEWGTLAVVATLIQSGALALVLIGLPASALASRAGGREVGAVAIYFGALGFGYVFLEMAAIQRLGLMLGHPVYATAATLAALLAFSGIGSGFSDRLSGAWPPRVCLAVAALAGLAAILAPGAAAVSSLPLLPRVVIATLVVAVPACLMGVPFPTGLRLIARTEAGVAWAWATNGVASVLGASLAVLIAMEIGGRALLALAGGFYVVAAVTVSRRLRTSGTTSS